MLFLAYLVLLTSSPYENYKDTVAEGISLAVIAISFIMSISLISGSFTLGNNPSLQQQEVFQDLTWVIIVINFTFMSIFALLICVYLIMRTKASKKEENFPLLSPGSNTSFKFSRESVLY